MISHFQVRSRHEFCLAISKSRALPRLASTLLKTGIDLLKTEISHFGLCGTHLDSFVEMSHSTAISEDVLLIWQKFPDNIRNDQNFMAFREEFDRIQGRIIVCFYIFRSNMN